MNEQKLYQYLGANVYRLRKQRGLTQSELAAYIGCNQKYISQIETGAAKASVSICYKIANTFSVSVDSLFTDPEKCVNAGENTSDREFAESITRTIIQYNRCKEIAVFQRTPLFLTLIFLFPHQAHHTEQEFLLFI